MPRLLDSITDPGDLKRLAPSQLPQLAKEIRDEIKEFTAFTGGHIGSGMGVVELTIALHYLFEFKEEDHLILDVGHQCYPHKMLTGRRERMRTIRQHGGLSGFPDPKESPYDRVKTGHGGTSLTTALGMAVGMKHQGVHQDRRTVAVIGDGSLGEGSAFEALNHGGTFSELPLLVILNDNEMSISPAVGSLSRYFSRVRAGRLYRNVRNSIEGAMRNVEREAPRFGSFMRDVFNHVRAGLHFLLPSVKPSILFEELGYFYYGPIDGHNIPVLLEAIEKCKRMRRPVILHCITKKGMGYAEEEDFLCYHAGKPDKQITAHLPREFEAQGGPAYTDVFVNEALAMAREDPRVVAISAAMLEGTGLTAFQEAFPDRCYDVGMAEQHAVGMAQGLALAGMKPICAIYSTFLQRSIDQLFQELSLIKTPVILAMDRAGLVGPDGATHNGVFDIAYTRMLPNFVVMAPRDGTELKAMMRLAAAVNAPSAIRFPRTATARPDAERPARSFGVGEAELLEDGRDGCLLAYGAMVYPALDAAARVFEQTGKRLAVVNARFAKPLDERTMRREFGRQPLVITIEDHMLAGGFGAAVLEHASMTGLDTRKLRIFAIEDAYIDHGQRVESLADAGLDVASMVKRIVALLTEAQDADASANRPADQFSTTS